MADQTLRGMVIDGRWVPRSGIERDYLCRHCGARVGRPYADPITGKLDFNRMVCAGEEEHEVRGPADLIHKDVAAWLEEKEILDADDLLVDYYWLNRPTSPANGEALYGREDFRGFGEG